MRLWIDSFKAPTEYGRFWHNIKGYTWIRSVNDAKRVIYKNETLRVPEPIHVIDLSCDAGVYRYDGGDYIELLKWLESRGCNYPIFIHERWHPDVEKMKEIAHRNNWKCWYDWP